MSFERLSVQSKMWNSHLCFLKNVNPSSISSLIAGGYLYILGTAICVKYKLDAASFSGELEAFILNNAENVKNLTVENIGRLEQEIQKSRIKRIQQDSKYIEPPSKKRNTSQVDSTPKPFEIASTPLDNHAERSIFASRNDQGAIVLTYNGSLGRGGKVKPSRSEPLGNRVVVTQDTRDFDPVLSRYRYMFTHLHDRARAVDKQIKRLSESMCEGYNIDSVYPLGRPSSELVWVAGRICCEAPEGKLNSSSVVLEGCLDDSNGVRVSLDVHEVPSYSLFPGQVVLAHGVSADGRVFHAKRIVEGISRPLPASPPSRLIEYHHSELFQGGQPARVMVASGPFTTMQNLNYEPFEQLLNLVFDQRPDALILLGPFVDASHPQMKDGDIVLLDETIGEHTASYEMVFVEKIVRDGLQRLFNSETEDDMIPTHIIMLPSLSDAHHEHVYPQPPFADRDMEKIENSFFQEKIGELDMPYSNPKDPRRRIHLMPNPCMFR